MRACICGHPVSDVAAFCDQCGTRLDEAVAVAAPTETPPGITSRGAAPVPGMPWMRGAPPSGPGPGAPMAPVAPMPGAPAMPGPPAPAGFAGPLAAAAANGGTLPNNPYGPLPPARDRTLSTIVGVVGALGVAIGALLDWALTFNSLHIPALFLIDLHAQSREPRAGYVLLGLAVLGLLTTLLPVARRWRLAVALTAGMTAVAYFVQVARLLSESKVFHISFTKYVGIGPWVTLFAAGALAAGALLAPRRRTTSMPATAAAGRAPTSTDGVVIKPARSGVKTAGALGVVVLVAGGGWFGYQAFAGNGGASKMSPPGAHFAAAFSAKPVTKTTTSRVLGIPITQYSATAQSKNTESILEETLPPTFRDDDAHSKSVKLVQATVGTFGSVKSSEIRAFQGHTALHEVRQIGPAEVSMLYVADGSRVYVIELTSTSSTSDAFERFAGSFEFKP